MSCVDTAKITGQHLLFLSTATAVWTLAQFQEAARFAKAHGVDTLLVKVADGTYRWYGGLGGYQNIKKAIQAEGVGCLPYTYCYGNKYGALDAEIDILIAYMQESSAIIADMEVEWNGQIGWAQHLCSRMQGQSGAFLVSTWADPSLQNWQGVLQAFNPCVSAYLPQQYSTYLGTFWSEFGASGAACLQPTFDMTQDFGTNDPVALAKAAHDQGHTAISIWYYETAVANPALLDQILSAFPKQEETSMATIPQGWTDDGTTLTAPNGLSVVLGFRDHVLNSNWDPANWPVEAETHQLILEQSNSNLGAGQRQRFRWITLEYTPKTGIFEAWTGPELLWYQGQYAALLAKIADLQQQLNTSTQAQQIAQLQTQVTTLQAEIVALQALPAAANLLQINTLGSQIVKLSQVQ